MEQMEPPCFDMMMNEAIQEMINAIDSGGFRVIAKQNLLRAYSYGYKQRQKDERGIMTRVFLNEFGDFLLLTKEHINGPSYFEIEGSVRRFDLGQFITEFGNHLGIQLYAEIIEELHDAEDLGFL